MALTFAEALPVEAVALGASASDWREAITLAGERLVASGAATDEYTREMIAAVEELGPYIVIAPGFALAHARPSPAVLTGGLSWVRLSSPVEFGHETNDPVSLVVGLAASDHDAHLQTMAALAGVLADDERMAELAAVDDPEELRSILAQAS